MKALPCHHSRQSIRIVVTCAVENYVCGASAFHIEIRPRERGGTQVLRYGRVRVQTLRANPTFLFFVEARNSEEWLNTVCLAHRGNSAPSGNTWKARRRQWLLRPAPAGQRRPRALMPERREVCKACGREIQTNQSTKAGGGVAEDSHVLCDIKAQDASEP